LSTGSERLAQLLLPRFSAANSNARRHLISARTLPDASKTREIHAPSLIMSVIKEYPALDARRRRSGGGPGGGALACQLAPTSTFTPRALVNM
jgi:hypothetical protein